MLERKINYAVEEENRKVPTQAKALSVFPIFRTRDIKQEEDLCFVLCHSSPHLIDSIKNK